MKIAALFAVLALAQPSIALVPLDDRPVTRQLPELLGRIAGVHMMLPPRELLAGI